MFSNWLLGHRAAKNPAILERIAVAKQRILSVLDRDLVAHERTLEQKISDQGPKARRVDPHLITLAIEDMKQLNRLSVNHHNSTSSMPWYSNIGTDKSQINEKLNDIAPLYLAISQRMSDKVGDALEVITYRALEEARKIMPRYHFDGSFLLDQPKTTAGRFVAKKCATLLHGKSTSRQPDFLQHGHDIGTVCIECKNRREWLYPQSDLIKHHILRCDELDVVPVFIFRRIHYSTITNFFFPAGIIAHESLYQYYPSDEIEIVAKAKHKRSLGFSDLTATEEPDQRTVKFFIEDLPKIVNPMATKWRTNRQALVDYANGRMNLSQLYNVIGSRGGKRWTDGRPDLEIDI